MRIPNLKNQKTRILAISGVLILVLIFILVLILNQPINKKIETSKDGIHLYENKNQNFTARFGYLTDNGLQHLVEYEMNTGEKLTMQLLNTNDSIHVYKTNAENAEKESVDIIKFDNVFNSVNVYYQITKTRIKEDIVLLNLEAPSSYKYSVVTSGVTLEDINGGQNGYIFKSGNRNVFGIPKLFMKDEKGEISNNVLTNLTLKQEKNGENIYLLEVNPEIAWLKADGRSFPVEIDPSVVFSP